MEFTLKELINPESSHFSQIVSLWSKSFGDSEDYIKSFYKNMPVYSTVCVLLGERIVSMALLISHDGYYYGYAVCTDQEFRGKGLCRSIHQYIKEKCERECAEYFIHPADATLEGLYNKLGMKTVLSCYETEVFSSKEANWKEISPGEYSMIRELYFGGFSYFPWSEKALQFMAENGISFRKCYVDGVECACAVDGEYILELCAPDHLLGSAVSQLFSGKCTLRMTEPYNPLSESALMSYSGKYAYFNLFLE